MGLLKNGIITTAFSLLLASALLLAGCTAMAVEKKEAEAAAAPEAKPAPEVKEVAPGVYAFIGVDGGTNSGFVVTDAGVVVIDTQGPKELAVALEKAVRDRTKKPVIYAVNTHYHGDHTFGNQEYAKEAREIIAHEYTREALISRDSAHRTRFKSFFGEESLMGFLFTPPTMTFSGRLTMAPGGRVMELVHTGPAHTGGDVFVHLPKERVVFTGDLLYKDRLPLLTDGHTPGAIEACDRLLALDAKVYVPGHGPLATKDDVIAYRRFLLELTDAVMRMVEEGRTLEEVKSGISLPAYSAYRMYDKWLSIDAEKVYREITGTE